MLEGRAQRFGDRLCIRVAFLFKGAALKSCKGLHMERAGVVQQLWELRQLSTMLVKTKAHWCIAAYTAALALYLQEQAEKCIEASQARARMIMIVKSSIINARCAHLWIAGMGGSFTSAAEQPGASGMAALEHTPSEGAAAGLIVPPDAAAVDTGMSDMWPAV